MMTPLWLLLNSRRTWAAIIQKNGSLLFMFCGHFLPLAALGLAAQALALITRPGPIGSAAPPPPLPPTSLIVQCEGGKLLIMVAALFVAAGLIQLVADSFACRASFRQSFVTVLYSFVPWCLCRVCDFVPALNPWAWVIAGGLGIVFQLYCGVPLSLDPPPAQAFGLFVGGAFIVLIVVAMAEGAMIAWLNHLAVPTAVSLRLTT